MREVPVELRAISKRYGGFEAVKSVSFSLMEGELCALIGENGAGKSTLIRLITGFRSHRQERSRCLGKPGDVKYGAAGKGWVICPTSMLRILI